VNITGRMCHEHGIRGFGNPDYGVFVVGIAPGHDEALRTKRPFTGASGRLLDDLLKFSGWDRSKVYATNAICWYNNAPNWNEIEDCSPRLGLEISEYKPKLVITMGEIAHEAVTGFPRKKGSRGSVVWSDHRKCYVLDTHHPAFALRGQSMDAVQDIIRDFTKINHILDWEPDGLPAHVSYNLIKSLSHAQQVLSGLPKDRPVAIDIETSNPDVELIDAYSDQLLCLAISYLDNAGLERTWVLPREVLPECIRNGTHVRGWRSNNKCLDPECKLPKYILTWPLNVQWTFQAGQYDINGLYNYFGTMLPLVHDTMLMSVCADERPGKHGLKENAREFLGAGWYNEEVKKYYKGRMNQLPPAMLYEYNAKDAAYTRRLSTIHGQRMRDDGTEPLYNGLLLPAIRTFIKMQVRGINIDQPVLRQMTIDWCDRWLQMNNAMQQEARDQYGWMEAEDVNFQSNPQLRKLFYNLIGLEPIKFSPKTGEPSLDKETLDQLDHPFAAKLRDLRTLDTMIDYVKSVWDHLKWDGLLHPSAFVTTTRTGRTSYHNPAMQTIPKDYTVGADYARLREAIVPHNPVTHEIIEADYNQIEVWLAWAESRDPTLLEHLRSGDVHSATAEGAFKVRRQDFSKAAWGEYRQRAKKIRFGLMYGEGAEKLSGPPPIGLGCTPGEARSYIDNFWRTYPIHRKWTLDVQRQVQQQGYIRTPSGRVMRFPVVLDHKALRQAVNFPIQSNASDYCLTSMTELAPMLAKYNSFVVLMVHDAIVVESDRRYRQQVIALIREVMQKPRFDGYPSVKVDVKVGDNLGTTR
jgi:uracil-DNA glycosylase family 4